MRGSDSPIRAAGGGTAVIRFAHAPNPAERNSTGWGKPGLTAAFGCD